MHGNLNRIIKWNRERNNLKFDAELEFAMLCEEAQEFYDAETFVDQVDAYCDFKFVAMGSVAKYLTDMPTDVTRYLECLDLMKQYISNQLEAMMTVLEDEWKHFQAYTSIENFLNKAYEAVITANEAKGNQKDENGKVMKGDNYVPPEETIEELLIKSISNGGGCPSYE